jgi:hypothetical protein
LESGFNAKTRRREGAEARSEALNEDFYRRKQRERSPLDVTGSGSTDRRRSGLKNEAWKHGKNITVESLYKVAVNDIGVDKSIKVAN